MYASLTSASLPLSSLIIKSTKKFEEFKEEEEAPDEDADITLRCYFACFREWPMSADLPVVISLSLNNACVFIVLSFPPIIVLTFILPTRHISQILQPRAPAAVYDGKFGKSGSYGKGGKGDKSGTYYDNNSSSWSYSGKGSKSKGGKGGAYYNNDSSSSLHDHGGHGGHGGEHGSHHGHGGHGGHGGGMGGHGDTN